MTRVRTENKSRKDHGIQIYIFSHSARFHSNPITNPQRSYSKEGLKWGGTSQLFVLSIRSFIGSNAVDYKRENEVPFININ